MRLTTRASNLMLSLLMAGYSLAGQAGGYHLGQGYTVGNVNIAGYVNIVAEAPVGGKAEVLADDLSLFVGGRFNKVFNPFFEAEIAGFSILRESGSLFSDNNPVFVVERIYNDSYLTDELSLRVGKMLAPVGEWNTIHAAPLVWTTSRPMTTKRGYPEFISGLSLNYSSENPKLPEVQLYWQPGGEISPKPSYKVAREYQNITGLHLSWPIGLTDKIGISLQHANVNDNDTWHSDDDQAMLGINARKTYGKLQLETETNYIHLNGDHSLRVRDHEWGAYVLGAYALTEKLSLLARYEHFLDRDTPQSSRNALLGLSYRPDPAIVWKVEYIKNSGAVLNIDTGFFASFSVLF